MLKARRICRFLVLVASLVPCAQAPAQTNLVPNQSFEQLDNGGAAGWSNDGQSYTVVTTPVHSGVHAIECENDELGESRGAACYLALNQERAEPLLVGGWSSCEKVSGTSDTDYSVYVDITYRDGTHLWGQTANFEVGTHGWQHRQVLITPTKPIQIAAIHALFRNHSGTAWFDDMSAVQLTGSDLFDFQVLKAPVLPSNARSGWFVRDAAARSELLPVWIDGALQSGAATLGLKVEVTKGAIPQESSATVANLSDHPRAISIYYVEKFKHTAASSVENASAGRPPRSFLAASRFAPPEWWNTIRDSATAISGEYANTAPLQNEGAVGAISIYPFGCVTDNTGGRMVGVPPYLGPRLYRIGYHSDSGLLFVAFDVALSPGHQSARVATVADDTDPAWGFRAAAARYYSLYPSAFERRLVEGGTFSPFTDPSTVQNNRDFSFAFHEGDNSAASDDKLNILSFRYSEPMSYWMPMPAATPRTYEEALAILKENLKSPDPSVRHQAEAVIDSGAVGPDGRYQVQFQNQPWTNGAVWVLDPNPSIPHSDDQWTKARIVYTAADADKRYGETKNGILDGEFLDSLEGWSDTLDYSPKDQAASEAPLTFAEDSDKPVLPSWFSVYELASFMSRDLHARHKLLIANYNPVRFSAYTPLLDLSTIEVNWLQGGTWTPDDDATLSYRRTLSGQKPYVLIQNTDFSKFDSSRVELFFQRAMFYGMFPTMFSADASSHPYFETPAWYNRDRSLFTTYIPAIRALSTAGWMPVTGARSDSSDVWLERFGSNCLTVMNSGTQTVTAKITFDRRYFPAAFPGAVVGDLATGGEAGKLETNLSLTLTLEPARVRALRLR